MSRRPDPGARRRRQGFTFLGLRFVIALMGLMAAAAGTTWTFVVQRDEEEQLLFVGREYRTAIERYAAAHARESQPYPTSLRQLLADGDRLVPVRYLRRLYADPMSGHEEWGLVKTPAGGITGVYSLSDRRPVRQRWNADLGIDFAHAKSYRDWVFAVQAAPVADGAQPGWNYERDGSPPLTWESVPPHPAARAGDALDNP